MEPKGLPKWAKGHLKTFSREMSQWTFESIPCGRKSKEVMKQGTTGLWLLVVFYQNSINNAIEQIIDKSTVRKTWNKNCEGLPKWSRKDTNNKNGTERMPKWAKGRPQKNSRQQGRKSEETNTKLGRFLSKINKHPIAPQICHFKILENLENSDNVFLCF